MTARYHYPDPQMLPRNRLDVDVELQVGDQWQPGTLEHWRQNTTAGDWEGHIRWSAGPGANHLEWAPADRLRPAPIDHKQTPAEYGRRFAKVAPPISDEQAEAAARILASVLAEERSDGTASNRLT